MDGKTVFSELWSEYRGIIVRSIVTSFGLDFVVHDQTGGDVDTIQGVRSSEQYKNEANAVAYEERGEYNSAAYHHNTAYDSTVRAARESQSFFDDAYVPGNRIFYGKASGLGTEHKANLDHVISAKEIHDDRGRVLAGLDGIELANQSSNLQFTNESLNKSRGTKTIPEYIEKRKELGNPLPDDCEVAMREKDATARESNEHRLATVYYASDRFLLDLGQAAAKRGVEMGVRQALGFVFIEIWCACEDAVKSLPAGVSFGDCLQAVAAGIQAGVSNAKKKYKDLLAQFEQGFFAGTLASLTTTLVNIFITTDKNAVRYIRQIYTVVVQVGNILLINPDDLLLGDQLQLAAVSLATGASVLAGTMVGNQIAKTPIGKDKNIGEVLQVFCSTMVSGLISCTLLVLIDRSQFISRLVEKMNIYGSVDHNIHAVSAAFIRLAAESSQYDPDEFSKEVAKFDGITAQITKAEGYELTEILMDAFDALNIPLPWSGDFNEFMDNEENCLVFD